MSTIFAAIAGLCSGTWPLFMRQTGLAGHLMPLAFSLGALAVTLPFAIWWTVHYDTALPKQINWWMMVPASVLGAGVLIFVTAMLARSAPESVGINLLILAMVQITVPAIYTFYASWGELPSLRLLFGLAASYVAVILLAGAK